jgi:plastocyanin
MRSRAASFVVGAVLVSVLVVAGTAAVIAAPERSASQEKVASGVTHVFIRNGEYSPSSIEVILGTAVTWTNQDNVPHGVVFSPVLISSQDIWQSGPLYRGESFTYTFTSRGTFSYRCSEHPEMLGIVIVT